jgi:hypothetical protein
MAKKRSNTRILGRGDTGYREGDIEEGLISCTIDIEKILRKYFCTGYSIYETADNFRKSTFVVVFQKIWFRFLRFGLKKRIKQAVADIIYKTPPNVFVEFAYGMKSLNDHPNKG